MKKDNDDIQIYLSKHVKARNLGINDIEIIDKECGILGIKKDQIHDRLAHALNREKRAEIHVLREMAHNHNREEKRYANERLTEIEEQEEEECTEYLGKCIQSDEISRDTPRARTNRGEGDFESFFDDYAKRMADRQK